MKEEIPSINNGLYSFGPFRLDPVERKLLNAGVPVPLSRKLFDLLLILIAEAGRLKTREELIRALWPHNIVAEHGLTNKLHALRKALGDDGDTPAYIETVHGIGYRFIAPVTREARAQEAPADNPQPRRRIRLAAGIGALLALAGLAIGLTFWVLPTQQSQAVPGIAVLPFENLSTDPSNAYLAAGIQAEILTQLAAIQGLEVIAGNSTRSYRSHPQDLKRIAQELGVDTLLEGSVQHVGKRVLVNVQLIDAATDAHLWAASYTRTLDDVFGVENDVAAQVVAALKPQLDTGETRQFTRIPAPNPQAYLLYLKANYLADRMFVHGNVTDKNAAVHQAFDLYHQAIALDPGFALAYARLARLEAQAYWFGLAQELKPLDLAKRDAKQALALDPTLPQAHVAEGFVAYYGSQDYAGALPQFREAGKRLPNDIDVIGAIGYVLRRQGDLREALNRFRKAVRLDPRNPNWPIQIGATLLMLRQYPAADQQFKRALALEPNDYLALNYRLSVLELTGKLKPLPAMVAKVPPKLFPGLVPALRFETAWLDRKPDAALAALAGAPDWIPGPGFLPYVPRTLPEGDAWTLKGDAARARQAYRRAGDLFRNKLRTDSNNPVWWSGLGLVQAGLGNAAEGIRDGKRAVELVPVAHDAVRGPKFLAALAAIYARVGKPEAAVKLLDRLLAMPAGQTISMQQLAIDPHWDSIRNNPAFKELLKKHERPTPALGTATIP